MSAALALRRAVHAHLAADAALAALLGGPKVFDEPPADAALPWAVLAGIESRDAGAVAHGGEEHRFALDVWSGAAGLSEALTVAARIARLEDAGLAPEGVHLVGISWLGTDARRSPDGRHRIASIRFRAVTEPSFPS